MAALKAAQMAEMLAALMDAMSAGDWVVQKGH